MSHIKGVYMCGLSTKHMSHLTQCLHWRCWLILHLIPEESSSKFLWNFYSVYHFDRFVLWSTSVCRKVPGGTQHCFVTHVFLFLRLNCINVWLMDKYIDIYVQWICWLIYGWNNGCVMWWLVDGWMHWLTAWLLCACINWLINWLMCWCGYFVLLMNTWTYWLFRGWIDTYVDVLIDVCMYFQVCGRCVNWRRFLHTSVHLLSVHSFTNMVPV
jgi:hypothetical protein